MRVIDTHAHLGLDEVFDVDFREEDLLKSQEDNGIDVTLVQPAAVHDLDGVQKYHDAVADLTRRFPGRFRGIACPNPHLPGSLYEKEVRRCIEELGFVGVKLHPLGHAVNPVGKHGRRVFRVAEELGVPVMVHTGNGIPWSAPSLLHPIAEEHPNLKIVVAHAGGGILSGEVLYLAVSHSNIYLEPSWVSGYSVLQWVKNLGANRVMFGSDHPENAVVELAKFRSLGLSQDELSWVLGRTAAQVFGLTM